MVRVYSFKEKTLHKSACVQKNSKCNPTDILATLVAVGSTCNKSL